MSDSECSESPRKVSFLFLNRYPLGGCGIIKYDASVEYYHASIGKIDNIAATPKGVASEFVTIMLRGESARFAHLIPSLCSRNPARGF